MDKPRIIETEDGSQTLSLDAMDETYHSTHGALTEAQHVYIENGFKLSENEHVNILEVGFGTGLNVIATLDTFLKQDKVKSVVYTTLEKFPLDAEITSQLRYGTLLDTDRSHEFNKIHDCAWEEEVEIIPGFCIHKKKFDLIEDKLDNKYNVVYYDAFAPSKQDEMWNETILRKVSEYMEVGAVFSTYCAKGDVRRSLKTIGLKTKRTPGPPGKWEMLVAWKV